MPERFSGLLLSYRGRTRLTQRQLAIRVGVNMRSVQNWEAGVSYPSAQRLPALIAALLKADGLRAGHEDEEAGELWAAVLREAPRMHASFDRAWFADLLHHTTPVDPPTIMGERRQEWSEAPDVLNFVGRTDELATLRDWVLHDRCRLIGVVGMGGIGKTSMAAKLAQDVAPAFQRAYWRNLRNAPPLSEWIAGAIGFLSGHEVVPPEGEAKQLAALLQLLRDRPCLLVLDNFETLLEPGQREGRYRPGLASYGALLQAVGETSHQSCVVLTSREAPSELAVVGGDAVRTVRLGGLGVPEGQLLLAYKQLSGNPEEWADLVARFGGNGLALKVVGESIHQLFGGDIGAFLDASGSGTVFGGMRRLLDDQIQRSSALEQNVLRVLAIEREPVAIVELIADLGPRNSRGAVLDAIEALRRRSLVERAESAGAAAFTLQSVVLEYVTDRLLEEVCDEIANGRPVELVRQPLIKARAKDYVRHSQERLIGEPVLQRLKAELSTTGAEELLLKLLDGWRNKPRLEQGFGPGNVVNLLRLQRGNLRGLDLAGLVLRQAYMAGIEAQDASLAGAHLSEVVLAEAFNYPLSVGLSGDGASLVAGTSAGEVWLWRVADRTPLLAALGHAGPVYGVALSADGQLLASGSEDGTVRLWEIPTGGGEGLPLATLRGHSSGVWGVALSADGRLVASGSFDGTIRLWEAPGGRAMATLQGHTGPVYGVSLSADGRLLASGGEDATVRLWDVPTGHLLSTLTGHTGAVRGVALSPDGRLLASGGRDETIRLWEAPFARLEPRAVLHGHTGLIHGVALSADGRLLASGSLDGTIRLWEVPSGQPLATVQGHSAGVRGVALGVVGGPLASASLDGTIRLWEAPSGRPLATLQGHTSLIYGVALSAAGGLLASGSLDGTIRLWELPTGRLLVTLYGHSGLVHRVTLSADGRLLGSGGEDGTVRLWESPSGRPLATLEGHTGGVRGLALSAEGKLLASGTRDGAIRLWEVPSGRLLGTLQGHTGLVYDLALSADGRLLASGSLDGTIRLWEAPGGRLLHTLLGHIDGVRGVALSADGRLLASGSEDGTVRLWEASSGELLATLLGHAHGVRGVALSADGKLLASGSWDGTIRLWESPSGRPLATLEGHTGGVWGVALSADGQLLASGSFDGTMRLWQTRSGICQRVLRSDRRYERVSITGLSGVTATERTALLALGAVEADSLPGDPV